MPFLRKEKKKSGTYLRIVESYRDDKGKSRHKTLHNLGKAENYSKQTLKNISKAFLELAGETLPDKNPLKELARLNYGFVMVYDKIMKIYGLDKLFRKISKKKNLSYDVYRHVLLMLAERLNDPASKLSNYHHRLEYYGLDDIDLHNLYRSLDHLHDYQQEVQEIIYTQGRNLFNMELDIVFYDVTTFYFESQLEDGFRMEGFSKDGKIGKTVIVFGLLIDSNKNPVGYKIYRGGFWEGHTFKDAVQKLKQQYRIGKVILVADRGMMSQNNIELTEESGYEFIIGERLKNLPKKVIEQIFDRSQYRPIEVEDEENGDMVTLEYQIIEHGGKRLIATYSRRRAKKDRFEREKRIEKGRQMLLKPSQAEKKARHYFLKKEGKNTYGLDERKIEADSRFDGFVCIATNNRELGVEKILSSYKQLYKIEHSFRTFKSYLETRPMFHWTQERIEGHLCLCYIAFTLLNYLQKTMQAVGSRFSENRIREALDKMQLSLVEQSDEEFYMRSAQKEDATAILGALKLKKIPDLTPKPAISNYISIG